MRGVLTSVLGMIRGGATHVAVPILFSGTNSADLVRTTVVYSDVGSPRLVCIIFNPSSSCRIPAKAGREWAGSGVNQQVRQANVNGTEPTRSFKSRPPSGSAWFDFPHCIFVRLHFYKLIGLNMRTCTRSHAWLQRLKVFEKPAATNLRVDQVDKRACSHGMGRPGQRRSS